jgi:hypothetical protein
MAKRRGDNTMAKRRGDNTMAKRRGDNTMAKRRGDNTMAKRKRRKGQRSTKLYTENQRTPLKPAGELRKGYMFLLH